MRAKKRFTFVCGFAIITFDEDGVLRQQLIIAVLCNGSTYDSDSYCLGSNPSAAAKNPVAV